MAESAESDEVLWIDPELRGIMPLDRFHVPKSLAKRMKQGGYRVDIDRDFEGIINGCAGRKTTWINDDIRRLYIALFRMGYAHSVEVWFEEELVGGLYGIAIGQVFFGESMFSRRDNASKVGFAFLCEQLQKWGYQLIDCQVRSEHLVSLGAYTISRELFAQQLNQLCNKSVTANAWLTQ